LVDDAECWPKAGMLFLDGFQYEEIAYGSPVGWKDRLVWLERQEEFVPGPYEQLAKVYRARRDAHAARKVLIAVGVMFEQLGFRLIACIRTSTKRIPGNRQPPSTPPLKTTQPKKLPFHLTPHRQHRQAKQHRTNQTQHHTNPLSSRRQHPCIKRRHTHQRPNHKQKWIPPRRTHRILKAKSIQHKRRPAHDNQERNKGTKRTETITGHSPVGVEETAGTPGIARRRISISP